MIDDCIREFEVLAKCPLNPAELHSFNQEIDERIAAALEIARRLKSLKFSANMEAYRSRSGESRG
jgi:hypothetical protein